MSTYSRSDTTPDYIFELLGGLAEKIGTKTYAKKIRILKRLLRIKTFSPIFFSQ
jgi:hypothetical protein